MTLNISQAALDHLAHVLDDADAPEGTAVRLVPREKELGMKLDHPALPDETFEHGERTVLVLDGKVSKLLADRTLDVEQTSKGSTTLTLR